MSEVLDLIQKGVFYGAYYTATFGPSAVGAGYLAKKSITKVRRNQIGVRQNNITETVQPILDSRRTRRMRVLEEDEYSGALNVRTVHEPEARRGLIPHIPFLQSVRRLDGGNIHVDPQELHLEISMVMDGETAFGFSPDLVMTLRIRPSMAHEILIRYGGEAEFRHMLKKAGQSALAEALRGGNYDHYQTEEGKAELQARLDSAYAAALARTGVHDLVDLIGVNINEFNEPRSLKERVNEAVGQRLAIDALGGPLVYLYEKLFSGGNIVAGMPDLAHLRNGSSNTGFRNGNGNGPERGPTQPTGGGSDSSLSASVESDSDFDPNQMQSDPDAETAELDLSGIEEGEESVPREESVEDRERRLNEQLLREGLTLTGRNSGQYTDEQLMEIALNARLTARMTADQLRGTPQI